MNNTNIYGCVGMASCSQQRLVHYTLQKPKQNLLHSVVSFASDEIEDNFQSPLMGRSELNK